MMAAMKLVYSCAPADYALCEQLSAHLHLLVQQRLLTDWHERHVLPGAVTEWERRRAWRSADILLLLLSADYFVSADYASNEMRQALKRQRLGQLLIIPILARPCEWQETAVAHLQPLPRGEEPVSAWDDRDAALLAIAQEMRSLIAARRSPGPHLSPLQLTNRQRLLKRVRSYWIEGLLEQSLHHAVWVDLHLQQQPDAVENPWRLVVQELDQEPRPLPPGTSIVQVFDQADEELLILGEPGAGKTTLLLYLARTLLDRAEEDEERRIPVIFPLSSWAQQRLPLDQWLIEELKTKYQVPRQIGQAWIESDTIFPLLDGLDEVAESARAVCVQAITAYAQRGEERIPLVISCRSEEYRALARQLPLQYAVMLLPFTNDQIDIYLSSVSGQLPVLSQALHEDKELFELARRPLFLSVFTLAYHRTTSVERPAAHIDYPQALFRYYVKHMLARRARLHRGTPEQVQRWLTYLANQMQRQEQTIFAVEDLQPAWLPERARSRYRWAMMVVYGLVFSLIFGPIFGLVFGCIYGLIYGVTSKLIFGLSFGLSVGLIGGLVGGLVFGVTFNHHQTIRPAEAAIWSGASAKKGLLVGGLGGLVLGAAGGLLGSIAVGPFAGIALGCAAALLVALVGGFVGGLSPVGVEKDALAPNEGIWRSGRRGLLFVVCAVSLFGLAGGLLFGLFGASIVTLASGPIFGIVLGAGGGLIFGLAFGLVGGRTGIAAFLQHFVLRFFLWRHNLLPLNLVAFLDEAAERLLLYKVGGKYIFVHRLLRDVLARPEQDA